MKMEKDNREKKEKEDGEKEISYGLRVSLKQLVMYAGASGDFNEIHYNFDAAKEAGFSRPIVHGMLSFALCIKYLMEKKKITPDKIKKIRAKFLAPVELEEKIDFAIEENDEKNFKVFLIKESKEKAVEC
ncbi:MAG: MaoC/PaaZ C-terminal domain-containing protein, partial [Candidatus Calescibacterium sp.]